MESPKAKVCEDAVSCAVQLCDKITLIYRWIFHAARSEPSGRWQQEAVLSGNIRSDLWNATELCTTSCFRDAAVCLLNEMHSDAQLYLLTCMTWHCWTEADRKILTIQPWLKKSIFYWIDLTLTFVKPQNVYSIIIFQIIYEIK